MEHFIVSLYDWSYDHHKDKMRFFYRNLNLDSGNELRDKGLTFVRNDFYNMESGVTFHAIASSEKEAIKKIISYINNSKFLILNSYKGLTDSDFVAIEY